MSQKVVQLRARPWCSGRSRDDQPPSVRETAASEVYRPVSKQEAPDYAEPFDVQADWDERA